MSIESPSVSQFSDESSENLGLPRAVSWAAVSSLVLGAASCTVLLNAMAYPLLCSLPILSVVLAVVALRQVHQAGPRLLGRKAALAGLALALLFGTWGVTQAAVRQSRIFDQARGHALHWLQLVQAGRLPEAYQLHLPRESRLSPGVSFDTAFANDREKREAMHLFFNDGTLKKLIQVGPSAQIQFEGNERLDSEWVAKQRMERVTQRFALTYDEDGRPQTLPLTVILVRKTNPAGGEVSWEVQHVALQRPPTS
jgi:hypothetical protein